MTEEPKRGRGRPPLPPDQKRRQTAYRLSPECRGAVAWLAGPGGFESERQAVEGAVLLLRNALTSAADSVESLLVREEWNLLADALNKPWLESFFAWANPAQALALEVHDAHALNGAGDIWFGEGENPTTRVNALVEKLARLDAAQAWAVLLAVHWFWCHDGIDHGTDEWWTTAFRQAWHAPVPDATVEGEADSCPAP